MSQCIFLKLSTGENIPYSSLEEVKEVMRNVAECRGSSKLVQIKANDGVGKIFIFPEFIMGYVIIEGSSLESISMSLRNVNTVSTTINTDAVSHLFTKEI